MVLEATYIFFFLGTVGDDQTVLTKYKALCYGVNGTRPDCGSVACGNNFCSFEFFLFKLLQLKWTHLHEYVQVMSFGSQLFGIASLHSIYAARCQKI